MEAEIIFLSFSVFVVVFLCIRVLAAKRSAHADVDYLLGNRSFGHCFVGLSAGATGNSGFIMMGAVRMGYTMGISGVILVLAVVGCTPRVQTAGDPESGRAAVTILTSGYRTRDGRELAMSTWGPEENPSAVVFALHGMNEYSKVLDEPAQIWARAGIRTIAYDQRGFGADPQRGIWAGWEILARDVCDLVVSIQEQYEDRNIPLFIVGESMGAAVATTALAHFETSTCENSNDAAASCWPGIRGVVLVSPAVAGRETIPVLVRSTTSLLAHSMPWLAFPVKRKLWLIPDIYDMLDWDDEEIREIYVEDPLFLGSTRIDATWGLFELMDIAQQAAPRLACPTLVMYGERDEILRTTMVHGFLNELPPDVWQLAVYEDGCHNLLAGRREPRVAADVSLWMLDPTRRQLRELPSGTRFTDDIDSIELGAQPCKNR